MAFNFTSKRAAETADIPLKNGDGSPLLGEDGKPLTVTVYGPASPAWEQATAEVNRRRAKRMRENGGKIEAALDDAKQDQIDFLTRVTVKFNGDVEHDDAKNKNDLPRAIYSDASLGFIREHVHAEANDWSAFTKGSVKD